MSGLRWPFQRARWRISEGGDLVRVPEAWLTTVVFLGYEGSKHQAESTAFFFQINERQIGPGIDFETGHLYLVTAAHCVRGQNGIYALINDPDGGVRPVPLPDGEHWEYHPTDPENVDIAVLPLTIETAVFYAQAGYGFLQASSLFDEADLRRDLSEDGYGIADELVAVGLFYVHVGEDRTLPLVRSGNLAMVPREPVTVKDLGKTTSEWLYIAELRSIGGMSGSPVFGVYRSQIGAPTTPFRCLGVLLGHWNARIRDIAMPINEGLAMVAPARILDQVLNQEALVKRRRQENEDQRTEAASAVVRDRASDATEPTEMERLEDLAGKVFQVSKEELDENRGSS